MARVPSPRLDLAQQEARLNLQKQKGDFFLRPHQKMKLGIGLAQESPLEIHMICLLSNSWKLGFHRSLLLSVDNPTGTF